MKISWDAVKDTALIAVKWHLIELNSFHTQNQTASSFGAGVAAASSSSAQSAIQQSAPSAPAAPSGQEYQDMMQRVAGTLYQQFYRLKRSNNVPPESVTQWDALVKIQSNPSIGGASFTDKPFLQRQGSGSRVTAIGYVAALDENKSRIQFVGQPNATSQGLHLFTRICSFKHEAIASWKVIHPQEGCTGPDSAVFYLRYPLDHATTQDFLKLLQKELQPDGADLPVAPLGLVHIGTGLYGTDLPSAAEQTQILGLKPADVGSAGTIICSILSQVGQMVALSVNRSQPVTLASHEGFMKANMTKLLQRLGWNLI